MAICCRIFLLPNRGCECREISRSESPNEDSAAQMAVLHVQLEDTVAERNGTWSATLLLPDEAIRRLARRPSCHGLGFPSWTMVNGLTCERQDQFDEVNETVEGVLSFKGV